MSNVSFLTHDLCGTLVANVRRYLLLALTGAFVVIVVAAASALVQLVRPNTIVWLAATAVFVIMFLRVRRRAARRWQTRWVERRRDTSHIASAADYVEGAERIPVVLYCTDDTIYYENPDLEASFELARVDEIEIDDELVTGRTVEKGFRVLRVRSHGAIFEFVIKTDIAEQWRPRAFRQHEKYNLHMLA